MLGISRFIYQLNSLQNMSLKQKYLKLLGLHPCSKILTISIVNHWKSYEITSTFIFKGKTTLNMLKLIVNRDALSALRHPESFEKLYLEYPKGQK